MGRCIGKGAVLHSCLGATHVCALLRGKSEEVDIAILLLRGKSEEADTAILLLRGTRLSCHRHAGIMRL